MELGRYLCEVRAGQYWRLENLKSFDEFLLTVSARETGGRLEALGFHTVRLDAGGRGLRFGQADCNRIHHLARRYGVPALGKGLPGCPHCKQIRSG